ncbi:MAG: response regulator [Chryseotalea sp.]
MPELINAFLVDDDDFSRLYFGEVLEQAGFNQIKLFASGTELIGCLLDKPDIIFLDYELNDFTGAELLEKINQVTPDTLTVMLSSQQDVKISVDLMNNGAFDYVVKSEVDVDKFKKIKERVLELQSPIVKSLGNTRYAYVAQKEKLKVQEEFAAELHDSINPLLSIAKLFLEMALKNPEKSPEYIVESKDIISSAVDEVRKLSHQIFFNKKQEENLETQLNKFIQLLEKQTLISINNTVQLTGLNEALTPVEQNDFLMLFKEIVNNMIKYAETTKADLSLTHSASVICLIVKDYGKGFDLDIASKGIGMTSILHRIHRLNGTYSIITKPGEGCCWEVRIPVAGKPS